MRLTNEQIKNIRRTYKISGSTAWHHEWVGDLLDTIAALESELALNQAAIVQEVAALYQRMNGQDPKDQETDPDSFVSALLAIPTDQPALDKYNYSQWERGYGDGITGMGAVLAGAPLENLPEANREQARRWIDRHDAELRQRCRSTNVIMP